VSQTHVALDHCLSPRLKTVLAAAYGHEGFRFLHLREIGVAGSTPDPDWATAYKRFGGKVVLSGDVRIATTPHLALAFLDNGLLCFFPDGAYAALKVHAQLAFLVHSWPRVAAKIVETLPTVGDVGTLWRIPCAARKGNVHLTESPLEPLTIPPFVLNRERQKSSR
jgi:hypothetical protein